RLHQQERRDGGGGKKIKQKFWVGPPDSIRVHFGKLLFLFFISKKMEVVEAVEASNQITTYRAADLVSWGLNTVIASTASMPPFLVDFNGLRPNRPPLMPPLPPLSNRISKWRPNTIRPVGSD